MADRPPMWLSVLGPLEVARGAEPVRLGSPQQRRVLAVLVVNANEVVSSDRLVDVLWGEDVAAERDAHAAGVAVAAARDVG